jgi:hypothetical protein
MDGFSDYSDDQSLDVQSSFRVLSLAVKRSIDSSSHFFVFSSAGDRGVLISLICLSSNSILFMSFSYQPFNVLST